jgi:hypothetical protein
MSIMRLLQMKSSGGSPSSQMIVAAPALVEAYAVLTRLPPPHRLSPQTALTLLENNFLKLATVIALNAKSYETLLLGAQKTTWRVVALMTL